jgi:hypothetical protein
MPCSSSYEGSPASHPRVDQDYTAADLHLYSNGALSRLVQNHLHLQALVCASKLPAASNSLAEDMERSMAAEPDGRGNSKVQTASSL